MEIPFTEEEIDALLESVSYSKKAFREVPYNPESQTEEYSLRRKKEDVLDAAVQKLRAAKSQ